MTPSRIVPAAATLALLSLVSGCGSRKIISPLKEQRPGAVSYSNTDGRPNWTATGSAKYLKSVPVKDSFKRQPHYTYIVFRDEGRNEDHVMAIEAAGDLTLTEGEFQSVDEGLLFRIVKVKPVQPTVSVSLTPKAVELADLSSNKEEPRILLYSNGKVRLKYPAIWNLDDVFGLDEVKSIKHAKGLNGAGKITFALAEKEYALDFAAGDVSSQHFAELERIVKPMAPHVQLASGRDWSKLLIWGAVILVILAVVIAKAAKK